jgi:hypothetical protein
MALPQLLNQALSRENCLDWGSKVQVITKKFWRLTDSSPDQASELVDDFIRLLSTDDAFMIASLILPELRKRQSQEQAPLNSLRTKVLQGLQKPRDAVSLYAGFNQSSVDALHYQQEKDLLLESEIYRVSILLLNRSCISGEEREQILKWLSQRPFQKV